MTTGMIIWIIIVCLVGLGVTGLIGYNIRSLIRKWRYNPRNRIDVLMGILVFGAAAVALWVIIVRFIISQMPA